MLRHTASIHLLPLFSSDTFNAMKKPSFNPSPLALGLFAALVIAVPAQAQVCATPQFRYVKGAWERLMPWFVISGPSGSRTPAHIEMGQMSVYYFSRNMQRWVLLAKDMRPDIGTCTADTALTDCHMTSSPSATAYSPNPLHGWYSFVKVPQDAQALSVSVQARVVSGGRALMTVGADYYPPAGVSTRGVALSAAGNSAPRYLQNGWTTVTMTTLAEQVTDRGTGISQSLLQRNSPQCSNPQS